MHAAGGALGAASYWANLRQLGNGVALWLGISPPDLFFYAVSGRCGLQRLGFQDWLTAHPAAAWPP